MSLTQKKHETFLLQELPPHARDIAEFLFNGKPLVFFLQQRQTPQIDTQLLDSKKVPHKLWADIIEASLLAKLTYIDIHPGLTRQEVLFLLRKACELLKTPLSDYSLEDVLLEHQERMPKFARWVRLIASQLKN